MSNTANSVSKKTISPKVSGVSKIKKRHIIIFRLFLIIVIIPFSLTVFYLFAIANNQYKSTVGFSVRSEGMTSPIELLGGLSNLSSGSSSDTDVLYHFIQSQELVKIIDNKLDLKFLYSKPSNDPFFAYNEKGTIEDLLSYWQRMVKVHYDSSAGLIELHVFAFDPKDAQIIAQEIFDQSSTMINQLSAIAHEDKIKYSRNELDKSVQRLKKARKTMTEFRIKMQIVDPIADVKGQMGLLTNLEQKLTEALIKQGLLLATTNKTDNRYRQVSLKIKIIKARIKEEREKFSSSIDDSKDSFSKIMGDFEVISVDQEFAQQAYLSALATYDIAQAEANIKSRYLAAYINPTLAEKSEYPRKWIWISLIFLFAFLIWAIMTLIYYSLRDRR